MGALAEWQGIRENGGKITFHLPGCQQLFHILLFDCQRKWRSENQTRWLKRNCEEETAGRKVFASVSPSVGHLTMPRHAVPWTQNTWGCGELISRHTPLLYITAPRSWVLLCSQNTCSLVYPLQPPSHPPTPQPPQVKGVVYANATAMVTRLTRTNIRVGKWEELSSDITTQRARLHYYYEIDSAHISGEHLKMIHDSLILHNLNL